MNPQRGQRAYHVGCGTGYFTAVLATLVGERGSVVGVDVDEALADRANDVLADTPNASILTTDGTAFAPTAFDLGLVSTGVSAIPEPWLDRLSCHNGRIVIPLAVPLPGRGPSFLSKGVVFLIERSDGRYAARMIGVVVIFTAAGATSEAAERRLMKSLMSGDPHGVRSLRRDHHAPDDTCWLHDDAYCLSKIGYS